MRRIYTIILYLLTPLVLMRLLWRSIKSPAYLSGWQQRFALNDIAFDNGIWLHAVSFGETQAALPLIHRLQERYPDIPLLITTTTPTGAALVKEQLIEGHYGNSVHHLFIPYDLPGTVQRFLTRLKPRVLIVMETELWPNLFHYCQQKNIPVITANTRLSARSAARYQRFSSLTRQTLRCIQLCACQTQIEADRLLALGANKETLHVTGNIKFDMDIPASLHEQADVLRRNLGVSRPVWIAASTHEGEDQLILDAHKNILKHQKDALLILVPRHPERFDKVAALCESSDYNFTTQRRSTQQTCEPQTQVFIGDSMGELRLFYAASDIAFVGGSLVATGGHNILEPAAFSKPVLFGPHMFNFIEASTMLIKADAGIQVQTETELAQEITGLFSDSARRQAYGERASNVVKQNRGALDKTLALITPIIDASILSSTTTP